MIRTEKIHYIPYHNKTYHGNYIYRGHPMGHQLVDGIMVKYVGNPFGLEDYQSCKLDKDGNPIK